MLLSPFLRGTGSKPRGSVALSLVSGTVGGFGLILGDAPEEVIHEMSNPSGTTGGRGGTLMLPVSSKIRVPTEGVTMLGPSQATISVSISKSVGTATLDGIGIFSTKVDATVAGP